MRRNAEPGQVIVTCVVSSFDAVVLARLLAEPSRRLVVAACVLGASEIAALQAATGLDARSLHDALTKLDTGGLIVWDQASGSVHLVEQAFTLAARATAGAKVDDGPMDERDKVIRAFVRDHRIVQIPMQLSKRLILAEMLAQEFEPGRRYSEKMVNLIIGRWHADTAAWRRYMVDGDLLSRDSGEYWRSGGQVPV
jgi:hypothetical protein